MAFRTRLDYSNNRQIRQTELTNTQLSGATIFGMDYNSLGGGIAEPTTVIGNLSGITSTFIGNTSTTNHTFGHSSMIVASSNLLPINPNDINSLTQTVTGYEGVNPILINGNLSYQYYTGSTYTLSATSITQLSPNNWSGETTVTNGVIFSGSSLDYTGSTVWVDVRGGLNTKRLIIEDDLLIDNTAKILGRDIYGNIVEVQVSGGTGTNYTAGNGLNLVGTVFSQDLTTNGSGSFIQSLTQTPTGIQVNLGTPPTPSNAVYTGSTAGLVPERASGGTINKYLREDGSWVEPPTSGGTTGSTPTNLGYTNSSTQGIITSSTGTSAIIPLFSTGVAGLVPARVGSTTNRYLREDGTWVTPSNTTYSAGNGLNLVGTTFSQDLTTNGSGSFIQSLTQTPTGIQVNMGNPVIDAYTKTESDNRFLLSTLNTIKTGGYLRMNTELRLQFATNSEFFASGSDTYIDISTGKLIVRNSLNVQNFVLQQNGNLGLGIAIPTEKLEVGGNINVTGNVNSAGFIRVGSSGSYVLLGDGGHSRLKTVGGVSIFGSGDIPVSGGSTYSAGNGLNLVGTTFSQVLTTSGSGTYVQSLTQTPTGIQVNLGTPPNTNTTYSAGNGLNLVGTVFSQVLTTNGSGSFIQSLTQTSTGIQVNMGNPPNTTYSAGSNITISGGNQISVVNNPTFTGNVTAPAFYESSLRELKENILPFKKSGIELINELNIVTFNRKDKSAINKIGIIADDSPKEFLSEELDSVDLYKTIFIQSKAIQELYEEIKNLKKLLNGQRN